VQLVTSTLFLAANTRVGVLTLMAYVSVEIILVFIYGLFMDAITAQKTQLRIINEYLIGKNVRYYPGIILTYLKGIAKQFNRDIQCTS
jgi:hypothetical protein